MCRLWRRKSRPQPSTEALRERDELDELRPKVTRVAAETRRLLRENNYAARIESLYQGR